MGAARVPQQQRCLQRMTLAHCSAAQVPLHAIEHVGGDGIKVRAIEHVGGNGIKVHAIEHVSGWPSYGPR